MCDRTYRQVVRRFATGVTIVAAGAGDESRGITANSFTMVSFEPQLVLVCVTRNGQFDQLVRRTNSWAVSVLAYDQEHVARAFAERGRDTGFAAVATRTGRMTSAPLIEGALATLECQAVAIHVWGDHSVLLGQVVAADLRRADDAPLLYYAGRFSRLQVDLAMQPHVPTSKV